MSHLDPSAAPQIAAAQANVMGASVEVFADVTPAEFPLGMEIILMRPGQLEPLARGVVPPGCMLGIVPPALAAHLRSQLAAVQPGPGQVAAPGVKRG